MGLENGRIVANLIYFDSTISLAILEDDPRPTALGAASP